jgi:hypothetical protein
MPQPIYILVERILTIVEGLQSQVSDIQSKVNQLVTDIEPPPPAASLLISWGIPYPPMSVVSNSKIKLFKETSMPVTLIAGQKVSFTVSPLDAQGNPSQATLSALSFLSSDMTVFGVTPDPANANGGIVQSATTLPNGLATDAATLTASATATEPDGTTTEQVSGVDTVTVNAAAPPPPPPPPVAATLAITWGTPA